MLTIFRQAPMQESVCGDPISAAIAAGGRRLTRAYSNNAHDGRFCWGCVLIVGMGLFTWVRRCP